MLARSLRRVPPSLVPAAGPSATAIRGSILPVFSHEDRTGSSRTRHGGPERVDPRLELPRRDTTLRAIALRAEAQTPTMMLPQRWRLSREYREYRAAARAAATPMEWERRTVTPPIVAPHARRRVESVTQSHSKRPRVGWDTSLPSIALRGTAMFAAVQLPQRWRRVDEMDVEAWWAIRERVEPGWLPAQ